ncbi:hypothetical protein D0962_37690 [Leptolyngbyaceae cyanobacterium CCMR0082]|uniref:Uncharacterized protein n=1 Tax=Adonisia turfae CCMR0082 TaxID=2304604 RepID=A0A6M0SII4_9CYAN|nr:hypothetical protein [Adonisia turfae CCMR0082]
MLLQFSLMVFSLEPLLEAGGSGAVYRTRLGWLGLPKCSVLASPYAIPTIDSHNVNCSSTRALDVILSWLQALYKITLNLKVT